ncbi:MAG: methyltransferase domain-containing protein [Limibacillus sp.]
MSVEHEDEYSDSLIDFLEVVWGEGYLSPGGAEEVSRILEGLDISGKELLDIGCGSGGIAIELVETYGAGHVTGIDVEGPVLKRAEERALARGLTDRLTFKKVEPGPLPFPDESFDVVFSKDSMIHIPDKEALFADVFRILRPGGWFVASDWLISHDGEPSPEMKYYVKMEELSFGMASPARYEKALAAAGFTEVALKNRNPWYREVARREREAIAGELYDAACKAAGKAVVDKNIGTWDAMLVVLESGEHCPHHLRARKPA